jgi:hypothetical protein
MFCLVSALCVALVICLCWYRTPLETGNIYAAICYKSDWDRAVAELPGSHGADFVVHTFQKDDPRDIFVGFSVTPDLWNAINLNDSVNFRRDSPSGMLENGWARSRPADCPVADTSLRHSSSKWVMDVSAIRGTYERSVLPPHRYYFKCNVDFTSKGNVFAQTGSAATNDGIGAESFETSSKNLKLVHSGPVANDLVVFSRPINDKLIHLVIFDLTP